MGVLWYDFRRDIMLLHGMVLVYGMVGGQYGTRAIWYQGSMVWGEILWSQMANLQCATCTSAKTAIDAISRKTLGNRSVQNAPKLHGLHVICRQDFFWRFTLIQFSFKIGIDSSK